MQLGIAVGVGFAAGLFSGVLGVGGGLILIPGMVLLLGVGQHTAQAVSLVVITATALVGAATHHRRGNVEVGLAVWIIPGAVALSLAGSWLAGMLDATWLQRGFAAMMFLLGARLVLSK